MYSPPMYVSYLSHREVSVGGNIVYLVRLSINGPVLLTTADNRYLEEVSCEVFVQKSDCHSDSKEDLTRCAAKRLSQLSAEVYRLTQLELSKAMAANQNPETVWLECSTF